MIGEELFKNAFTNDPDLGPGMHVTWLVSNPDGFARNPGASSDVDRQLDFGLSYGEWRSLFFDVLGANGNKAEMSTKPASEPLVIELEGEIPGYPMLSRIKGYLYDAVFRVNEVQQLSRECSQIQTSNELARRGLRKLIKICDLASEAGLSIYLMAE